MTVKVKPVVKSYT